jgi:hypothetical protein
MLAHDWPTGRIFNPSLALCLVALERSIGIEAVVLFGQNSYRVYKSYYIALR